MGGDDKYRAGTLLFCVIFFVILTAGHSLALYVQGSQEIADLEDQLDEEGLSGELRTKLERELENSTDIDFLDVLSGIGNILFGLELPLPFTLLISIVNGLLLISIAILSWSLIRAHIPLISG
jgi:hypothetical protein